VLQAVVLALGGQAGVQAGPPAMDTATPRLLGVNEFALRRGRRNSEAAGRRRDAPIRRHPAESSKDYFAAWLAEGPVTEVICLDRTRVYSDRGTRGAPEAVQIADRRHRCTTWARPPSGR
jgi:hypothetical protein